MSHKGSSQSRSKDPRHRSPSPDQHRSRIKGKDQLAGKSKDSSTGKKRSLSLGRTEGKNRNRRHGSYEDWTEISGKEEHGNRSMTLKHKSSESSMSTSSNHTRSSFSRSVSMDSAAHFSGAKFDPNNLGTCRRHDDKCYVRMPYVCCSPGRSEGVTSSWPYIEDILKEKIYSVSQFERVINHYNPEIKKAGEFEVLHRYILEGPRTDRFFDKILPAIQKLVLQLPGLLREPLALLKQRENKQLTISQAEAASILANAFFCTFPGRSFHDDRNKLSNVNFNTLFTGDHPRRKIEKLKCLIHYFERVTDQMPSGMLTFRRCCHNEPFPSDINVSKLLSDCNLSVCNNGKIEDSPEGTLQVNFANKFVGGGVLGHGLVQEEIRFLMCPEMIVSRLFTEVLDDEEVLIMKGCERFSSYDGYGESFKWNGDFKDETERDDIGRRSTEVVGMDAKYFSDYLVQFKKHNVLRELKKAYCAFKRNDEITDRATASRTRQPLPQVCTGNWGCGTFGGDRQLKSLIQCMAAAMAGRKICFYLLGDVDFTLALDDIMKVLEETSVGHLLQLIEHYYKEIYIFRRPSLFDYLKKQIKVSSSVDQGLYDNGAQAHTSNSNWNYELIETIM